VTAAESIQGRYYALVTLVSMIAWFDNWSEVWRRYRRGAELPPLRFRRDLVLHHRPEDQALMQFYDVFRDKNYRRYITEPRVGTIVDIGANIGVASLDWATRLPHVRIHAYEPHPGTFAMLAENIAANHLVERVICHQQAVGREAGTLTFHTAGLSVLTTAYKNLSDSAGAEFTAATVSLDQVLERCAQDGAVGLVKIDAEGAEAEILEGAHPETLKQIRQFVIEYHDSLCPNALGRCERVLTGANFRCAIRPGLPNQGLLYAWRDRARA
jgi:FkbM family methyltransferase